jgi:hypothetical protein
MVAREDGGLRADAAQNRARLLAAAREVFAEQGIHPGALQGIREPTDHKTVQFRLRHIAHDEPVDHLDVTEGIWRSGEVLLGCQPLSRLLRAHTTMLPHAAPPTPLSNHKSIVDHSRNYQYSG